jgi:hypothetical protein
MLMYYGPAFDKHKISLSTTARIVLPQQQYTKENLWCIGRFLLLALLAVGSDALVSLLSSSSRYLTTSAVPFIDPINDRICLPQQPGSVSDRIRPSMLGTKCMVCTQCTQLVTSEM